MLQLIFARPVLSLWVGRKLLLHFLYFHHPWWS